MSISRTLPAVLLLSSILACQGPATKDTGAGAIYRAAEGAIGPYSGSVQLGDICFAAGKIGTRGEGFEREVETAIDAVEAELARSNMGLSDVVSTTVYLTDMGRYSEFNAIYASRFAKPYPARTCVAVRELPAGAAVEIQVIASNR